MKKSFLLFAFTVLVCAGGLFAKTVNVENAKAVAINFFKVTVTDSRTKATINASLNYTRVEADNTVDYYVFNITPGPGFVIVSADDVIVPVIGYSTEANFESDLNRTGVVDWMEHAAKHIYRGIQENLPATDRINELWTAYNQGFKPADAKSTAVAPLIYTAWNQEPYYNALCPLNTTSNTRCVTGCVATTMAQIMKYWSYPAQGTGSNSYDDDPPLFTNSYGTQSANFGATTYDWNAMPVSLNSANNAVATLMYQCGVSVDMDYGTDAQDGSSAAVLASEAWGGPCAQTAYTTYFSYNPNTIQGIVEQNYSAADWLNLIETDLSAGRPVQYEGRDPTAGGHTWVCDGFDGNGLLHMNWGWGGNSNGYYAVNSLSAGGYDFSTDEGALTGIEPLYPTVSNAIRVTICQGDTAQLTAKITNNASYTWTPSAGLSCPTCAFTMANPIATTVYLAKADSAGVVDTTVVIVSVNPRVLATATAVNLTCYGYGNGTININATGGIPGYSYAWNNGLSAASVNTLAAGSYQITVTDAVGCTSVVTETLTQPAEIFATTSATGTGCGADNGTASVVATGGAGGLTYRWSNGQTDTALTNLGAGAYVVSVTDRSNCTTVADAVVTEPYQIQFTANSTNTINGEFIGTASIENVSGGTAPYTYAWSDGETTATIVNLEAGIYTVTITDHSGCFEVATDTIISTPPAGITSISDAFSFSVFPNPTRNLTTIQLGKVISGTTLKLENVLGQTLLTQPVGALQTLLDLSAYPDGVYIIEIKQGDKRAVKELVLSR